MREHDDAREWRAAILITLAALSVRLIFATLLPLFPDETYYWDWSRHPASGYFDHPPAIAILIRWGTLLAALFGAGPSPLAVRFFPVLAGGAATLFSVMIARRLGGGRAARIAAIVFSLMPLAATGLVLATPDAPLLAASAAGLYFVVAALQSPSSTSWKYWCAAGVALGLAFSSKYTSILLPITVTAAVLSRSSLRARLREPGPYLACIIATLVFLPVLYWNAKHDWISFRFQIEHGLGAPKGSALKRELDLIGGQLGLVSPIFFVLAAHAVWRTLKRSSDDARFTLAIVAVGSWVFFAYSAMRRSVEPNWPAPSYVPGIALLAALASTPARDRWIRGGMALAALLITVIYVHSLVPILPLPARRDPVARSAGWDGLAATVEQARVAMGPRTFAGADRYQDVSELGFHLPGRPQAFCACIYGRRNQYDLWPTYAQVARPGDNLVLALDESADMHGTAKALSAHFTSVTRGALAVQLRGADTVSVRRVWLLSGYRGGWPSR